jgi:hypothetical protein
MRRWNRKRGQVTRRYPLLSLLLIMLIVGMLPVSAWAADELKGQWRGAVTLPGGDELALELTLEQPAGGDWSGTVKASILGEEPIRLENLSVSGTAVSWRLQPAAMPEPVIFSGNYSAWNDAIRGVLVYAGESLTLRLDRLGVAPGVEVTGAAPSDTSAAAREEVFQRIRHTTSFGITVRANLWKPLYIIREDRRNINDIATGEGAMDASLRWYAMDDLAFIARYVNGGLGFHTNAKNLALFGFTGLEYLDINGFELAINAYIGDILTPNSDFNPYLTACFGKLDWQLGVNGPDSEPYRILDEAVEGSDYGLGFGLGVEYLMDGHYAVEVEWLWRYIFTEDATLWPDTTNLWTNTHIWAISCGLVRNF